METTKNDNQITLTIKGGDAQRGVSLSDFESFIDQFPRGAARL